MSKRRTILASLLQNNKPIEIVQSKTYNTNSIAGGGSINISFNTPPKVGNKIIIMIGCDQIRFNNLVGGSLVVVSTGASLPGRVWTTTDYSNIYTVQNTSASPGTFRIVMLEVKNCSSIVGVESLSVINNTITSSPTNVNKNEMLVVFLYKQANQLASATNSFNETVQSTQVSAWSRLYTTNELTQTSTLSHTGATNQTMRHYTLKLIP